MMRVLSLGWGTQSFTLAALSALGELPPLDAAVHADTGHERQATYEFAAKWTPWLEEHGVRVVTVKPYERSAPGVNAWGGVMLPAYTNGGHGQFARQCTDTWKREPIRRWLQANRGKERVQQWLGITGEEMRRVRDSNVAYIEHAYPFLGLRVVHPTRRGWLRRDCVAWLEAHGLEIPPRSACTFCPLQSKHDWARVRACEADWSEAVAVDDGIRDVRPPEPLFVLRSCVPQRHADLAAQPEFDGLLNECSGMCGV